MVCGPRGSEFCLAEAPVKGHDTKVALGGRGHSKTEEGVVRLTPRSSETARFIWIQTHGWMFPENRSLSWEVMGLYPKRTQVNQHWIKPG